MTLPYNGSGVYNLVMDWVADAAAGIKIRADRHMSQDTDFANALSNVITKDGQTTPTADIKLGGKRLINVADPAADQDAVTRKWVSDNVIGGALIADSAPAAGKVGNLWWDSDQGGLYLRYDDGSSVQWVQCNVAPPIAPAAPKSMTAVHAPGNTTNFDVSLPPDAEWDVIDISVVSIISTAPCIPYVQPLIGGTPLGSGNIVGSTSTTVSTVATNQWSGSIFLATQITNGWQASGVLTLSKTGTPVGVAWCGGAPAIAPGVTFHGGGWLLPTGAITGMRFGVNAGTMTEGWVRVFWR